MASRKGSLLERNLNKLLRLVGFKTELNRILNSYEIDVFLKYNNFRVGFECKQYENSSLTIRNLIHQWDSKNKELNLDKIVIVITGVNVSIKEHELAKKYNIVIWDENKFNYLFDKAIEKKEELKNLILKEIDIPNENDNNNVAYDKEDKNIAIIKAELKELIKRNNTEPFISDTLAQVYPYYLYLDDLEFLDETTYIDDKAQKETGLHRGDLFAVTEGFVIQYARKGGIRYVFPLTTKSKFIRLFENFLNEFNFQETYSKTPKEYGYFVSDYGVIASFGDNINLATRFIQKSLNKLYNYKNELNFKYAYKHIVDYDKFLEKKQEKELQLQEQKKINKEIEEKRERKRQKINSITKILTENNLLSYIKLKEVVTIDMIANAFNISHIIASASLSDLLDKKLISSNEITPTDYSKLKRIKEIEKQNMLKEFFNSHKGCGVKLEQAKIYDKINGKEYILKFKSDIKNGNNISNCLVSDRININDQYYIIIRMDYEKGNLSHDPVLDTDLYEVKIGNKGKKLSPKNKSWHHTSKDKGIYKVFIDEKEYNIQFELEAVFVKNMSMNISSKTNIVRPKVEIKLKKDEYKHFDVFQKGLEDLAYINKNSPNNKVYSLYLKSFNFYKNSEIDFIFNKRYKRIDLQNKNEKTTFNILKNNIFFDLKPLDTFQIKYLNNKFFFISPLICLKKDYNSFIKFIEKFNFIQINNIHNEELFQKTKNGEYSILNWNINNSKEIDNKKYNICNIMVGFEDNMNLLIKFLIKIFDFYGFTNEDKTGIIELRFDVLDDDKYNDLFLNNKKKLFKNILKKFGL